MDTTMHEVTLNLGGRPLTLKSGFLAPQANATCLAQYGETVVLAVACATDHALEGLDFLPFIVNVEEKFYAAGRLGGSRFLRREGRPSDASTLASRLVDRPFRPLFDKRVRNEVQLTVSVLSTDFEQQYDILSIIASSAALHISDIPWAGPVGAVRMGMENNELILNPTLQQLETSDLDLTVAGTGDGVVMVESGAREVSEDNMVRAIEKAHEHIKTITDLQEQFRQEVGKKKVVWTLAPLPESLSEKVNIAYRERIEEIAFSQIAKKEKEHAMDELKKACISEFVHEDTENPEQSVTKTHVSDVFDQVLREATRASILLHRKRVDGRQPEDIRPIDCQVGLIPRVHGSALFTRGETQAINLLTLGAPSDAQLIEDIENRELVHKRYIHHYNAPPYSLGMVGPMRGPKRREIGHGHLAERALLPVLPPKETFPYTMRLVSEVLSQNGSSSMASTCASTLSLMDAGVPITAPVSGIAMGLVMEGSNVVVLSDIQGWEDALGDMDFKVTGTSKGITALQLDIKVKGLTASILKQALEQARAGRLHILDKMTAVLPAPRTELSSHAPHIVQLTIPTEKIGAVVGPQGKIIKKIIEETGVNIDIEDDGSVYIAGDAEGCKQAKKKVEDLTATVEIGKVYEGKVTRVMDFGAIVQILPNSDGMVHISQWANERIPTMQDVVKEGETITVKVLGVDDQGRVSLSRKALL